MRFVVTLASFAVIGSLASCKSRRYNTSEVKTSSNIVDKTERKDGTFMLRCKHLITGEIYIEEGVTAEQIEKGFVCNRGNPSPGDGLKYVNAKLFNAFDVWNTGTTTEISQYPLGYSSKAAKATEPKFDDIFYSRDCFASRTRGARTDYDELTYPVKENRKLQLQFVLAQGGPPYKTHDQAVEACKSMGKRLPVLQELVDFCNPAVTGRSPPMLCGISSVDRFWSATISASRPEMACVFSSSGVNTEFRDEKRVALCVGGF
jgi:hypothetical protein